MNGKSAALTWMSRLIALPIIAGLGTPAFAGGDFDPKQPAPAPAPSGGFGIKGELEVELQSDHTYKSEDPDAELTDTYNTTELGVEVTFNRYLSLIGGFTFEPVLPPGPGEDRIFEDEGLYAEQLYGKLALGHGVSVFGGKFNPAFGTAWDKAPGIYGVDFAEDYEITERLGFGTSLEREKTALGKLTLTGSLYHADTTELSRSVFTDRGRTRLSSGGVSNTEDLDSFALALDGEGVPALAGNNLHLGYRFQQKGKTIDDLDDEQGYVAGINGKRALNSVDLSWIGEVVYLHNAEGTFDELWYYTLGGAVKFANRYNIAVSYTGRPRDISGGGDLDDKQLQISAGLELRNGWTADAGYKYHVEDDVDNHTVGFLLAKTFAFGQRKP